MTGTTRPRAAQLSQLIWLTAVWVLLWGHLSVQTLLGGLLVALLVTVALPLPPVAGHLSMRPLRLLRLAGYLAVELVVSGVEISWETLRYGPRATAGIVEVPLLTDSDYVIAALANAVSLTPGEFVLQIDRRRGVCYVYSLGVRAPADAERVRGQVLVLQRRVVAALGSPDELAALGERIGGAG
ncbi:MAG: Na+/H+ antiporter subunit E [Pseudonocardiaceae bacterium]